MARPRKERPDLIDQAFDPEMIEPAYEPMVQPDLVAESERSLESRRDAAKKIYVEAEGAMLLSIDQLAKAQEELKRAREQYVFLRYQLRIHKACR